MTIHPRTRAAFTILEVLVGVSLMTIGIVTIMALFPYTLKTNERAELRTLGASLAYMKIEEIRRDNDDEGKLLNGIRAMTRPSDPVPFASDWRLAYRLSGVTMLYQHRNGSGSLVDDPGDPRDDPGVARVIIQENPDFRKDPQIFDEYRFN